MFRGSEMDIVPKFACDLVEPSSSEVCRPSRDIVIICNLVVKLRCPQVITRLVTLQLSNGFDKTFLLVVLWPSAIIIRQDKTQNF